MLELLLLGSRFVMRLGRKSARVWRGSIDPTQWTTSGAGNLHATQEAWQAHMPIPNRQGVRRVSLQRVRVSVSVAS